MAGSDEIERVMAQLQGLMQSGAAVQVMAQAITAYDQCAAFAMQSFIASGATDDPQVFAERSWAIADAMMVERRKRGLGAMPQDGGGQ